MHDNHLTNRGTTTALADYAHHLTLMGHEITIGYKNSRELNDARVISLLGSTYTLRPYEEFSQIHPSEQKTFDCAYFIKAGKNDGIYFTKSKSVIHSVFQYFEPHGNKYAYVSEWLAKQVKKKTLAQGFLKMDTDKIQNSFKEKAWVPHMISLPTHNKNLRSELGIPNDALVGLRYGGFETFDLEFVQKTVCLELIRNPNFWFIAVNTKEFWQHPRLLNLPGFFDQSFKLSLLNTADFFLHARSNGESFGLSILEAMHSKTPVLSWKGGTDKNHLRLLHSGSTYRNGRELVRKMQKIPDYPYLNSNYSTASKYTPDKVMDKFFTEFIQEL
ncbi:GT4_UGDG-like domain containing protein [Candidatus Nanopelagicaceae bacterium]